MTSPTTPTRFDFRRRNRILFLLLIASIVIFVIGVEFRIRPDSTTGPGASASASPEPAGANVLIGAGDIADCGNDNDAATADLIAGIAGTVFTLGDNVYDSGSAQEYRDCYDPTWGRFRDRTRPVPGNHDYVTDQAAGYFGYFGPSVGTFGASWYAYDLGTWRIYALDSDCSEIGGCGAGSPELAWLTADLAAQHGDCSLAYWHHPRFSSGPHGDSDDVSAIWSALQAAGVDVVLSGHDHLYERIAPLDAGGNVDPAHGIREFVVGTGGESEYPFLFTVPGSEVRQTNIYGVLEVTLRAGTYDWQYLSVPGQTFTDVGSGSCHSAR